MLFECISILFKISLSETLLVGSGFDYPWVLDCFLLLFLPTWVFLISNLKKVISTHEVKVNNKNG